MCGAGWCWGLRWGTGAGRTKGGKEWGKNSQLQTERDTQHLKSFHLKVHSDGGLVVLIKCVFAEPEGAPDALVLSPVCLARITFVGSPSCDCSWPGSPERPLCLPSALLAQGSSASAGHAVAQLQDWGLGVNPLLPLLRVLPCPLPAAGGSRA